MHCSVAHPRAVSFPRSLHRGSNSPLQTTGRMEELLMLLRCYWFRWKCAQTSLLLLYTCDCERSCIGCLKACTCYSAIYGFCLYLYTSVSFFLCFGQSQFPNLLPCFPLNLVVPVFFIVINQQMLLNITQYRKKREASGSQE